MPVHFFNEDVNIRYNRKRKSSLWIKSVIKNHEKETGNINIIFCSDAFLHQINNTYLKHDNLTDIITFQYNDNGDFVISGDIFLSIGRVKENALKYKTSFEKELHRVMIHGILHLCGHKDKTESEQKLMRQLEDNYLSLHPDMS